MKWRLVYAICKVTVITRKLLSSNSTLKLPTGTLYSTTQQSQCVGIEIGLSHHTLPVNHYQGSFFIWTILTKVDFPIHTLTWIWRCLHDYFILVMNWHIDKCFARGTGRKLMQENSRNWLVLYCLCLAINQTCLWRSLGMHILTIFVLPIRTGLVSWSMWKYSHLVTPEPEKILWSSHNVLLPMGYLVQVVMCVISDKALLKCKIGTTW